MLDMHKLELEIAKMMAETVKLNNERRYYPLVIASTILGAAAALAGAGLAIFKILG